VFEESEERVGGLVSAARSAFPGWQGVFDLVWGVVLGIVAV
jgi:hypothetical protein